MDLSIISEIEIYSVTGIILLISAGFLVGVINTFAGSGTAITYYLFMLLGLPANYANGTIRLGVIMQTMAASLSFKKQKVLSLKGTFPIIFSTVIGTLAGAFIAVNIREDIFEIIIGIVMIFMLVFIIIKPEKWIKGHTVVQTKRRKLLQVMVFFLIGIYGGFIHIGVGIFLLAALVLISGYDLVKANALKVFIVFIYSPFVLLVFIISGQLDYGLGLIASIGNLAGGIIASRYAVIWGTKFIRWFLIIVIVLFASNLFNVFDIFN